jgi:hypothetical protein
VSVIEINRRPPRRDLLWFGGILPVFFAIVGTVARVKLGAPALGWGLWAFGTVLTAAYWALPPLRIAVYLAWMHAFFPLGWLVSHTVLGVLFFLVATPLGLLLRLVGHDPMKRRRDGQAKSYWVEQRTGGHPSRYLRQF